MMNFLPLCRAIIQHQRVSKDGSETLIEGREQIMEHEGIFGIEKSGNIG